ncbi:family 16 glycosylhydrolase [Marinoscillum sp. MHG1-6]|uniref:family 16 glycosylhydrolase n=1 Tax=Marinoscillum sp. MHG1-6 TaxID=2959627 RepID=UPI0021571EE7|nr:family 16 glycosylhydrolase [Marinoscillum sp. MHG1-6]
MIPFYNRQVLSLLFTLIMSFSFAQCPNLVWSDEFDGTSLNTSDWTYQLGTGCDEGICGWGNNELQSYAQENVSVSNGNLTITAKKERIRGSQYTSGRINTINKQDFTYGRFEARIKLPEGGGLWPAFWMLPTDNAYGAWPQSGEIDIMEYVSWNANQTLGYIHYGDLYPGNQNQGSIFELHSGNFFDSYHDFALEWDANELRWFVDGILFQTKTPEDLAPYNWPFDQPFHIIMNVAVGGNLGGEVDNTIFPASMDVDYVRVYDGFRPYIDGKRSVEYQASGDSYHIGNVPQNANISWSVPAGATITSGQGSSTITVDWGTAGGNIVADVSTSCGSEVLTMEVAMNPPYVYDFSFENFDQPANVTLLSTDGVLTEVANPAPNTVNPSSLCASYDRNSSAQYDVIAYEASVISNAGVYVTGDNRFYMDVNTAAPVGTEIIIQLESPDATPSNYPDGRHSRYFAYTTAQNEWHRVYFEFADRPDGSVADNNIASMLILFNSNTFTGDTYYFDNLDAYKADTGGSGGNNAPSVTLTAPSEGSSFTEGEVITLSADATDSDGSVTQVTFFVDGNEVGTDNTSPYSVSWTVTTGAHSITAQALDNEGASTTSSAVSITGQSAGPASTVYVSSIVTGTQGAGQGSKYGTATVSVVNNLGHPVADANVNGTFSGSFSESVSGTTNGNGEVSFVTSTSLKGGVIVDFCVDDVTHSTLTYDPAQNVITCTNGGARLAQGVDAIGNSIQLNIYPNPVDKDLNIRFVLEEDAQLKMRLFDLNGRTVRQRMPSTLISGEHEVMIDMSDQNSGIYFVEITLNEKSAVYRIFKH